MLGSSSVRWILKWESGGWSGIHLSYLPTFGILNYSPLSIDFCLIWKKETNSTHIQLNATLDFHWTNLLGWEGTPWTRCPSRWSLCSCSSQSRSENQGRPEGQKKTKTLKNTRSCGEALQVNKKRNTTRSRDPRVIEDVIISYRFSGIRQFIHGWSRAVRLESGRYADAQTQIGTNHYTLAHKVSSTLHSMTCLL